MSTLSAQKFALLVLSDPRAGSEEALGRVFNALAAAYEYRRAGAEVSLVFLGTGTRWLEELVKADHPAHALFLEVQASVAGASCGCAEAFGATEGVLASGFPLLSQTPLPGTGGVLSLRALTEAGYTVLSF